MEKFHIKSIVLGIGIGIVLTAFISFIYVAGYDPGKNMSDDEIIQKAQQLGMIEASEFIKDQPTASVRNSDETSLKNTSVPIAAASATPHTTIKIENTPKVTNAITEIKPIPISVYPGDVSEVVAQKLFNAGLVESVEVFETQITELGMEDKIEVGDYQIKKGSSIKEIISIITKS